MTYPSSQKLVDALEQELLFTGDQRLRIIIARAKSDYYHDFFGEPAMPEIELFNTMMALGHRNIADRVKNGDFDATKEESDEWARSEEGQETFRSLIPKSKKSKES